MGGDIDRKRISLDEERLKQIDEQAQARMEAIRKAAETASLDEVIEQSRRTTIDYMVATHEVIFGEEAAQNMRDQLEGRKQPKRFSLDSDVGFGIRRRARSVFPEQPHRTGEEPQSADVQEPEPKSRGFFHEYNTRRLHFGRKTKPFTYGEDIDLVARRWGFQDRSNATTQEGRMIRRDNQGKRDGK